MDETQVVLEYYDTVDKTLFDSCKIGDIEPVFHASVYKNAISVNGDTNFTVNGKTWN